MAKFVGEKLGRPVQLMKDPAVKGTLTGTATHVPTIDASAIDPTVEIKNLRRGERRPET